MAKVFGNSSDYQFRRFMFAVLVLFIISSVILIFLTILFHLPNGRPALIGLVVVLIVFVMFRYLAEKTGDIGMNFFNGMMGEKRIYNILKDLPDTYTVFWGVKCKNNFDTDFVVLGPTGLFVVEVKSQIGKIDYDGSRLIQNGHAFPRNFLKQVKGEGKALSEYIKQKIGINSFFEPILVFSSLDATLHFGKHLIDGVMVIKKDWLRDSICNRPFRPTNNQDKIEKALIEITPNA